MSRVFYKQKITMKKSYINNLEDLFEASGGVTKLASSLGLEAYQVEYWRRAGINPRHWDKLYELYGLSPAELFSISKKCKARRAVK